MKIGNSFQKEGRKERGTKKGENEQEEVYLHVQEKEHILLEGQEKERTEQKKTQRKIGWKQ